MGGKLGVKILLMLIKILSEAQNAEIKSTVLVCVRVCVCVCVCGRGEWLAQKLVFH